MDGIKDKDAGDGGFSLPELLVAMAVTLVLMGFTGQLLARSFEIRTRENRKTEVLANVQRALNLITREVGNSGYGLRNNGILVADSGGALANASTQIRVRANLDGSADGTSQVNEDVTFMYQAANSALVRFDRVANAADVVADALPPLAGGVAPVQFTYLARNSAGALVASTPANAEVVRFTITSMIAPVSGDQQASPVTLTSDITLRNAIVLRY